MSVTKVMPGNVALAGIEVFTELEEEGQLNIYEALQTSLTPFAGDGVETNTLGFRVEWHTRLRVIYYNTAILSLRQGYPPRYDFGTFRYLYGASCQPLEFVDTTDWMSAYRHSMIVVPGVDPDTNFQEDPITTLDTYDLVASNIANYPLGSPLESFGLPATQFAWSFRPGVNCTINVAFFAVPYNQSIIPGDPLPTLYWFLG